MRGRLCAAVLALVALVIGVAPAGAAFAMRTPNPPQNVPAEVADTFANDVLTWVLASSGGGKDAGTVATVTGVSQVHEVFGFTPAFVSGDPDAAVVRSLGHWVGVLVAGADPVGVATVEGAAGSYAPATFRMSTDAARALAATRDGYYVEGSPATGSWVLRGDLLSPADAWAQRLSADPVTVEAAQTLIAASAVAPDTGWSHRLLVVLGLLVAAVVLALFARTIRRHPHSPSAAKT